MNKKKGGKGKRRRKRSDTEGKGKDLDIKLCGQEYARVTKMLGDCRLLAFCFDGKERMCKIRGAFRKRVWIREGDFILVGLRDFQDDKADIIGKYSSDEVRRLRVLREIPAAGAIDFADCHQENEEVIDTGIDFDSI